MAESEGPALHAAVLDELLDTTGGDRDFLGELIDTYLDDAPRQVAAMRRAVADGDADSLVRAAHTLKGASASMGALELSERSRGLETAARTGSLDEAPRAIDGIEIELARVRAALAAIRAPGPTD